MRKTGEDPGFVEAGAEAGIEANCRGVPAEDDPLHLPTPLSDGDTSESGHHRLAGAGSALFEQDEKILDEEHRFARESGIREVVDGNANRTARARAEQRLEVAVAAEAVAAKTFGVDAAVGREALVFCEAADQGEHRGDVAGRAGVNVEWRRRFRARHQGSIAANSGESR